MLVAGNAPPRGQRLANKRLGFVRSVRQHEQTTQVAQPHKRLRVFGSQDAPGLLQRLAVQGLSLGQFALVRNQQGQLAQCD